MIGPLFQSIVLCPTVGCLNLILKCYGLKCVNWDYSTEEDQFSDML